MNNIVNTLIFCIAK